MQVVVALLALLLAGCAGRNFVRPAEDALRNGQTSLAEVQARYGQPMRSGSIMKNDKNVRTVSYAYAATTGSSLNPGVTPARAMGMYFHNDVLVGHEFMSSWADDHTNFDETRVKDIAKGKTTRQQVVQMFGRPAGYYVHPMIKAEKGDAVIYVFVETRGFTHSRKLLVVTLDGAGVVSDVEFATN